LIDFEPFGAASALLRELLNVASGGVAFTTIQKFFPDEKGGKHPLLSDLRNVVVDAASQPNRFH
jgi:type I restriction enzyme R subunit